MSHPSDKPMTPDVADAGHDNERIRHDLAALIWNTSRADESTISATGANVIAEAILASGLLAQRAVSEYDALPSVQVVDDGRLRVQVTDRMNQPKHVRVEVDGIVRALGWLLPSIGEAKGLMEREAGLKAAALRDAAEAFPGIANTHMSIPTWLRARADEATR